MTQVKAHFNYLKTFKNPEVLLLMHDLTFGIGGSHFSRLNVEVAKAHLELPSHSMEDVISVDVAFHGLPKDLSSGTKADATNELKLTYTS